jgi:4-amino-4-deoxy-L-arabinose transferase-like glycosyltransferase
MRPAMSRVQLAVAVAAVALVAVIRIAVTQHLFSPTWDEPLHVASGHQYLHDGKYNNDRSHPPLPRIAFAWPLRHAELTGTDGRDRAGQLYEAAGNYMRGVTTSRRGNLIFVVLAIVGVALWTVQLMGRTAAAIAAAIFSLLPVVLAHGTFATTDMAGTAGFALAMAAFQWWLTTPTWPRTALLALAVGVGLVSKFSFPLFFLIGAATLMFLARKWPIAKGIAAAVGALAVVTVVYRFKLPLFFKGLRDLAAHNFRGHDAFFFGQVSSTGWFHYFPVLLVIKTPIPALILMIAGIMIAIRTKRHRELAIIAGLLLFSSTMSSLNLGVRHVMPMYVPLSMLAAFAVMTLWTSQRARWAVAAAGVWLLVSSALAHPDYLPWANALGGREPERIALDSNFDWGQDVLRLRDECRRRGITSLYVALFGTTDLRRIGLPPAAPVDPAHPAPGWHALSESEVRGAQARDRAAYRWLTDGRDFVRVGKSIRLYEVK